MTGQIPGISENALSALLTRSQNSTTVYCTERLKRDELPSTARLRGGAWTQLHPKEDDHSTRISDWSFDRPPDGFDAAGGHGRQPSRLFQRPTLDAILRVAAMQAESEAELGSFRLTVGTQASNVDH